MDIIPQEIKITKENVKDFFDLDIVAFAIAYAGAQGDPGSLIIVTSDSKLYYTNHILYGLPGEDVYALCPIIEECKFALASMQAPDGWQSVYLGGGNFLVIKDSLWECLKDRTENLTYNEWKQTIFETMASTNKKW